MGNHLCKALAPLTDERGKVVFANETFTVSTKYFTDHDGNVVVPPHVQVLGGDDLPLGAAVATSLGATGSLTNGQAIKPSEVLPYTVDPTGTYTIDQEPGAEHTVQTDIPAAPGTPPPGEPTLGTPGSPAAPAEASAEADQAQTSSLTFDRAAAFARLKALGKPAPGNTSNARLEALLQEAEAAVMTGGQ